MNWLIDSIHTHPTSWALGSYAVISNAISAMPTPTVSSSAFYRWFFGFSQAMASNVGRIIATKNPQAQQLVEVKTVEPTSTGGIVSTTVTEKKP